MSMQSVSDLQNTLSEMQSILNNTIEPLFNDLELISNVYEPIMTAQNTLIQKCDEVITFLNSGSNGTGTNGLSAYELATLNGFVGDLQTWLLFLKGLDGQNGTNGTNGTNGVDGLSAYQVALNNGFVGTEAEWIDSLVFSSPLKSVKNIAPVQLGSHNTTSYSLLVFSIPMKMNTIYEFVASIMYTSSATTNGITVEASPPNGTVNTAFEIEVPISDRGASTTLSRLSQATSDFFVTGTGVRSTAYPQVAHVKGVIVTGSQEDHFQIMIRPEVNGQTISITDWSFCILKEYTPS